MLANSSTALEGEYDVCVVGSGPAGLACALRCQERGLRVLVLEAGGLRPVPGSPDILAADIETPDSHDPTDITAASAFGGGGHWWGGRCVPLDPVDFDTWPVSAGEMRDWTLKAATFLGSEVLDNQPPEGALARMSRFHVRNQECWGPQLNMAKRWAGRLLSADAPTVVTGARVTQLTIEDQRIATVHVRHGGEDHTLSPPHTVLACGGLGVMRLLLMAQQRDPALFGGPNGPLGRGYMGHLTGSIARFSPAHPNDIRHFHINERAGKLQSRRRFQPENETVRESGLANISFWIDSATISDPDHPAPVASARHLAGRLMRKISTRGAPSGQGPLGPHVQNVMRSPLQAAAGLGASFYYLAFSRVTGRHPRARRPTPVSPNVYRLDYHAEQTPHPDNRVSLSGNLDSLGMPKLRIRLSFHDEDIRSVVQMHDLLDEDLRRAGAGELGWRVPPESRFDAVKASARDGYHQLGGAVMSSRPTDGVVAPDGRVHGVDNLWIASSCTFPTGGQANPTLSIVALSLRLSERLAELAKGGRRDRTPHNNVGVSADHAADRTHSISSH
ncbi:MAG: GMC oxidoreductase [Hyphomonadaceae bacterium]